MHKGEVNSSYGLCLLLVFLCYRVFSLGYSQDGGDTEFEGLALMKMRSWSPAGFLLAQCFCPQRGFSLRPRFFPRGNKFGASRSVSSKY